MKQIPLTRGKFALVDDSDYDWLMQWDWYCNPMGYAQRTDRSESVQKTIKMHRLILGDKLKLGMVSDHINRDKLDNRRGNLRACVQAENRLNSSKCKKDTSSQYLGVTACGGNWRVNLASNGKKICSDVYASEIDAALAYNRALKSLHQNFSNLNPIPDDGRGLVPLKHALGKSKLRGVSLNHARWQARINSCGKRVHLGTFDTPEEAYAARLLAEQNQ